MNISLTPELEKRIQEKVSTGFYNSASEVIRDALRLLFMQDEIRNQQILELRKEIDLGLEDLEKGNTVNGQEAYKRLKARNKKG